ncbi:hypothetical protein L1887_06783 [Cichorium endivia]|nr:hypothetical protein L1887_06783 [Cichorium endivia]
MPHTQHTHAQTPRVYAIWKSEKETVESEREREGVRSRERFRNVERSREKEIEIGKPKGRQGKHEKKCEAAAAPVLLVVTGNDNTTAYGGRTKTLGVCLVLWCSVLMTVLIAAIHADPRKKKAASLLL